MRMDEIFKLSKCGLQYSKPSQGHIVKYFEQEPMTLEELQENKCGICSQCKTRPACGRCRYCSSSNNFGDEQICFHQVRRRMCCFQCSLRSSVLSDTPPCANHHANHADVLQYCYTPQSAKTGRLTAKQLEILF